MGKWKVPIAYERYGYLTVDADSREEAIAAGNKILEDMTEKDMEAATEYLSDSEEVDVEGVAEV